MIRLLFVCLGNICRSPAGENTMRQLLREHGLEGISLDSAGTAGWHRGKGPDPRMSATLKDRGIAVTGKARQFVASDFDDFDLILAMDEENRGEILKLARDDAQRAKVRPFMSFCVRHDLPEVPDPYYGGKDGFELVADIMWDGCEGILRELGQLK